MKQAKTQPGFIMILVLMVTALTVVLASYLMNKTMVFVPIAKTTIETEKAEQLALGGLQLAMSQLAYAGISDKGKDEAAPEEKTDKQPTQQQQPPTQPGPAGGDAEGKKLLEVLLPVLNRWQQFTFDKAHDGFEGTISVCVMSEDGKININEIYDFNKHAFIGKQDEIKTVLKTIFDAIKKQNGGDITVEAFEKFLKERQSKLFDVTELITIKGFESFKDFLFYVPSDTSKSDTQKNQPIYLTDLFTIWSQSQTIDPWLLSTSVIRTLGLKQPEIGNKEQKEKIGGIVKTFRSTNTWPADWNKNFAKLYEKEFNGLPKGVQSLLGTTFAPRVFSVLSQATVGKFSKRCFAIIEREKAESPKPVLPQSQAQQQKKEKPSPAIVTLKKLYWI